MRKTIIAALAAAAFAAMPAAAQTASGQGNQSGSTTTTSGPSTGSGTATGSTASGFSNTFNAPSGSVVTFSSSGADSAHVDATPFSISAISAHAGAFEANALGGGSVTGTVQNFGQNTATVNFTTNGTAATTSFVAHSDFSATPGFNTDIGFEMPN